MLQSERRIFEKRIIQILTPSLRFPFNQTGFRKNHSTLLAAITSERVISQAKDNQPVVQCFLDIKSAFDKVIRGLLWKKLLEHCKNNVLVYFLYHLMENMTSSLYVGNSFSPPFFIKCGFPQGSSLSPILYAVNMFDLSKELNTVMGWTLGLSVVNHTFFADDIKLINSPQYIQQMLNICEEHSRKNGYQLSLKKSGVICETDIQFT